MGTTNAELLKATFGIETTERVNELVTQCETTLTRLTTNNPNRLSLTFINSGASNIFLSFHTGVAVGVGIRLGANGSSVALTWDRDMSLVTREFYGIASGAASAMEIIEVVSI